MDYDNILFRCSSLGALLTEPKSKADKDAGKLSETAKQHLIEVFVREKYGRAKDISSKFISKGLQVEEDSITLYSRYKKIFFKKNDERIYNDFIQGEPDLYIGESIMKAEEIIDIKSSWDIFTFFATHTDKVNSLYYAQLQGYMYLTGAKRATLAYCLVSTPESFINDEKRKVFYKMNITTEDNEIYQAAAHHLELAMTYEDIPLQERVHEIKFDRDEELISKIKSRVEAGREYIREIDEKVTSKKLLKAA